jgi:hypothetical protein
LRRPIDKALVGLAPAKNDKKQLADLVKDIQREELMVETIREMAQQSEELLQSFTAALTALPKPAKRCEALICLNEAS